MFIDHSPVPVPVQNVLVLDGTETDPEEVIEEAICGDACLDHPEDGRIFYVVFLSSPRQVDAMTERVLRQAINKQTKRVLR